MEAKAKSAIVLSTVSEIENDADFKKWLDQMFNFAKQSTLNRIANSAAEMILKFPMRKPLKKWLRLNGYRVTDKYVSIDKSGCIYLCRCIQGKIAKGAHRYESCFKYGRTTDIKNRLTRYAQDGEIVEQIYCVTVDDMYAAEKYIKNAVKNDSRITIAEGAEYVICDQAIIEDIFNDACAI